MFNQPKRHPYHDFPLSLAKEYLTELDPHQVQKSWSKRQIIYQDYPRLTVLHDAFDWQCSDAVILEFCKVWGDPADKKSVLALYIGSPLTIAIAENRSFELISKIVKIGGSLESSKNWFAVHKHDNEFYSTVHAASNHSDVRVIQAMHKAGVSINYEHLYIAFTTGDLEVFEYIVKETKATFDWMAIIRKTLLEARFHQDPLQELSKRKMNTKIRMLLNAKEKTNFHSEFLVEKIVEHKLGVELFEFFKYSGFEDLDHEFIEKTLKLNLSNEKHSGHARELLQQMNR